MSAVWAVPAGNSRGRSPSPVPRRHAAGGQVVGVTTGVVMRPALSHTPVPVPQAQSTAQHIPVYAPMSGGPGPDMYGLHAGSLQVPLHAGSMHAPLSVHAGSLHVPLAADRIYSEPFGGDQGYMQGQIAHDEAAYDFYDYDPNPNDPHQEQFQLGDEASNVNGSWRTSWEEPPDTAENQFLALLESLESRVDLMSQMQHTRVEIQQQTGLRPDYDTKPELDAQNGHFCRLNEEVTGLREKLQGTLGSAAALHHADRVASVLQASSREQTLSSDLHPAATPLFLPLKASSDVLLPFCPEASGLNLEISQDGYTATRFRGCRQSVAVGTGPVPRQEVGRYFEITVEDTVPGWVGGLGIGVTSSTPQGMKRVPDKAWRIQNSMVIGYWGCVFIDGCEQRTAWRADSLHPGAKVGFLVTYSGDLLVFVDGEAVVRVDGAIPPHEFEANLEPLYPVVDVFAATRVVSMSPNARPPPRSAWNSLHSPIAAAAMKQAEAEGAEQREAICK